MIPETLVRGVMGTELFVRVEQRIKQRIKCYFAKYETTKEKGLKDIALVINYTGNENPADACGELLLWVTENGYSK